MRVLYVAVASRGMTVRGVFLLIRLTHRRNGGTRSAVQFSPMNSTPPTATLALGLDTFGDVTVDADGRLLSQAQVVRDVIAEGRGSGVGAAVGAKRASSISQVRGQRYRQCDIVR